MSRSSSPTELVDIFEYYTSEVTDLIFPQKQITVQSCDKPYFTEQLRKLRRQKMREYSRKGKSEKFIELQQKYLLLLRAEVDKYKNKIISQISNGNRGCVYKLLRRLGNAPGDLVKNDSQINSHIDLNLKPSQSAESISKYFTSISQEYQPLNLDCISSRVREFLTLPAMASGRGPLLSEHEVYMKIKSAKKPNSYVKGR